MAPTPAPPWSPCPNYTPPPSQLPLAEKYLQVGGFHKTSRLRPFMMMTMMLIMMTSPTWTTLGAAWGCLCLSLCLFPPFPKSHRLLLMLIKLGSSSNPGLGRTWICFMRHAAKYFQSPLAIFSFPASLSLSLCLSLPPSGSPSSSILALLPRPVLWPRSLCARFGLGLIIYKHCAPFRCQLWKDLR